MKRGMKEQEKGRKKNKQKQEEVVHKEETRVRGIQSGSKGGEDSKGAGGDKPRGIEAGEGSEEGL